MQKRQSQIPFTCKKLYEKNLIAGLEGNVSERKGDHVLITASQVSKSDIQEKDLCLIDLNGKTFQRKINFKENHLKPQREIPLSPEQNNLKLKGENQKKSKEELTFYSSTDLRRDNKETERKKERQDFERQSDISLSQAVPKPSSELEMHLAIYKAQEKAQAVIHAHPPSAIALSVARPQWQFLPPVLPEMIVLMGQVPIVPYTRPGTKELGESLKSFVKKHQALILSHHGAVVWAESLNKAFFLMEQLEQCCKVLILAESLGGAKQLPQKEIEKLTQS